MILYSYLLTSGTGFIVSTNLINDRIVCIASSRTLGIVNACLSVVNVTCTADQRGEI